MVEAGNALAEWHAQGWLPAAVLEVGTRQRQCARIALGAGPQAVFDLASLTKVLATGLVAASAVDRARLSLDDAVATWVDDWREDDRRGVTIRDLLTHASGLPAHAPLYEQAHGEPAIVAASARASLVAPPRREAIYSDLGFIVLGAVLSCAMPEGLAAATRTLLAQVSDASPRYHPETTADVVPTGVSPWRGQLPPGAVHDDNAAAMDGVAGHAGLFGTAAGVGDVARAILSGLHGNATPLARPDVLRAFTRRSPVVGSTRALAWDTSLPTSSCGPALSAHAIGHTGFTGTSLWIDPHLDLYVVLLTNRVAGTATAADMAAVRRVIHTIIGTAWRGDRRA